MEAHTDGDQDRERQMAQAMTWCAVLLFAVLIVGVLCLVQLMDISDALGG